MTFETLHYVKPTTLPQYLVENERLSEKYENLHFVRPKGVEDDEDKMPEEAFMKYTKDSRAGSPAPSATAKVQQATATPFLTSLIGGEGGSRGEDTDQGGPQGIAGFWSRCPWDRRGLKLSIEKID